MMLRGKGVERKICQLYPVHTEGFDPRQVPSVGQPHMARYKSGLRTKTGHGLDHSITTSFATMTTLVAKKTEKVSHPSPPSD